MWSPLIATWFDYIDVFKCRNKFKLHYLLSKIVLVALISLCVTLLSVSLAGCLNHQPCRCVPIKVNANNNIGLNATG